MKHGGIVVAGVALAAAAVVGGWTWGRALSEGAAPSSAGAHAPIPRPAPAPPPSEVERQRLQVAEQATVRITPPGGGYVGSGTVVSQDGLLLTNAHVAVPWAPGLADLYGGVSAVGDPAYLVIAVPSDSGRAVPAYRASVVAADGYLDLAVLRIGATFDGQPLPTGQRFHPLPVGGEGTLAVGDRIDVLGYPVDLDDGARLSRTAGRVVGFTPDPTGRVQVARWAVDTSARLTGGYSGGAAVDRLGRLVGVPSASLQEGHAHGRIRPVELAAPLLAAARRGARYDSPHAVRGTGQERARPLGWGLPGPPCGQLLATRLAAGLPAMAGAAYFSGMTRGEDVVLDLGRPGEAEPLSSVRTTWGPGGAAGCLSGSFVAEAAGQPGGFPPGVYEMRVRVGPRLRLLTVVRVTVVE